MTARRLWQYLPPLIVLAALAVLPAAGMDANNTRLLFITFTWITASLGWNLLGGYAGQVSFGFAVFYGMGAYTAAMLIDGNRVHPAIAFVAAGLVAAIASVLIGLPTFRLRGPYFAIATIGVSETVRVVATNVGFTGGASGYRIVERGEFVQAEHYYSALLLAAFAVAISFKIAHSKFGLGLVAINQDEDAAADTGVNPFRYKLAAHAVAAALTGMAGGVFARYAAFIHPQGVFGFNISVSILLMPVIGGLGTVWGAVMGGVVFGIVEEEIVARFPDFHLLIYGGLLIIIVLLEPGGILGFARKIFRRIRERGSRRRANPASGQADEKLWGVGSGQRR
ncbi:MAG: branched-chain amino acid ABC transporter permease [Terriglobales bacterium]